MPKKKTPEQYKQECIDKHLDLPIEDYKGARVKIKHICKYEHVYEQTPEHHLRGHGCTVCADISRKEHAANMYKYRDSSYNTRQKTPEQYLQECIDKHLDLPVEPYVDARTSINHRCQLCGELYKQKPMVHLRSNGGTGHKKHTMAQTALKTHDKYVQECKKLNLDLPIEKYKGDKVKINHKCPKGHVYKQTPHNHLASKGCRECYKESLEYTPEQYYNLCEERGYDLPVEDYKGTYIKIKHKCIKGHTYKQEPRHHLRGIGCPVCNMPYGERYIEKYLKEYHYNYESQVRFEGLRDKYLLSYDFYLPNQNILIEYQGKQHYKPLEYFGGAERYKVQQYHDKLKAEYAKDNGYNLICIPYTENTYEKVKLFLDKNLT